MSTRVCTVVKLTELAPHPDADSLDITTVYDGYPCIVRKGSFQVGDLAIYIPVDMVLDVKDPRFSFLDSKGKGKPHKTRAIRLRGIFSMGILLPVEEGMVLDQDVTQLIGAIPYEEPEPTTRSSGSYKGGNEAPPPKGIVIPKYDIESIRKYGRLFKQDETVVIEEKIHGCNGFAIFHDRELHIRSRTIWKQTDPTNNVWAQAADKYKLAERLSQMPGFGIFFEVFGPVQDMKYGVPDGDVRISIFDVLDTKSMRFLDWEERGMFVYAGLGFASFSEDVCPPVLYRGPMLLTEDGRVHPDILALANGPSYVSNAQYIREGFVIRPAINRYDMKLGRLILKLAGEDFEMRR